MSASAMNTSNNGAILIERVNLLCRNTWFAVGGGLLTAVLIAFLSRHWVDHRLLWLWLGAVSGLSLIRLMVLWYYRHAPADIRSAPWRARVLITFNALSGCLWGFYGYVALMPGNPSASSMVVMVLVGLVAGAVSSLAPLQAAFYAFSIPVLAPVSYQLISLGGEIHITAAALILLFLLVSLVFCGGIQKTVLESIQLRYENLELIQRLQEENRRAEAALIDAERANIAKSKFLAAASHDLRQPLHALILFAESLKKRVRRPEIRAIAANIDLSVRALESLFNALLDISKLDADMLRAEKTHFKLQSLFDRLLNDYLPQARKKHLTFTVCASDLVIYSDSSLLERVLRNLVSNAVRYTTSGGVSVGATVVDHDRVKISVSDSGSGIDKAYIETVFDEFVQLDNPERDRSKGLGLGLSIVKRIAKLLDHPLTVSSMPGRGSEFSLIVALGDPAKVVPQPASGTLSDSLEPALFIVVIDDEKPVRDGMVLLLNHWGFQVLAASSEQEALDQLAEYEYPPDVILADYRLREHKTGTAAIAAIRRRFGREIPALLITGDTAPDRLQEAQAGGFQLLHKPFQPAQLRAFLQRIIAHLN